MTVMHADFQRFEIKYHTWYADFERGRESLSQIFQPDRHPEYLVQSIYFDSPRYRFYQEKREGLYARVKPRLRIYRAATEGDVLGVFLELKYRADNRVHKQRVVLSEGEALAVLHGEIPLRDSEILAQFGYLSARYALSPCVNCIYKRVAYASQIYDGLRLTYDSQLRSSLAIHGLAAPSTRSPYAIDPREAVVELKYNRALPQLMIETIRNLGWTQATFSKYAASLESQFSKLGERFEGLTTRDVSR